MPQRSQSVAISNESQGSIAFSPLPGLGYFPFFPYALHRQRQVMQAGVPFLVIDLFWFELSSLS